MEEEFIRNQERLKPQEEKIEEERSKVYDLSSKTWFCVALICNYTCKHLVCIPFILNHTERLPSPQALINLHCPNKVSSGS